MSNLYFSHIVMDIVFSIFRLKCRFKGLGYGMALYLCVCLSSY